jgi:2-(1,2-epoxy-1,2-dihydrophenyl)acetyl-CoA isomerase
MESLFLAERASSNEGKEGISAFLEKREAVYLK